MSHLTTELCEKYPGERIQQWEYDLEAEEWASVGFVPTAFAERSRLRLPPGCYFSQTGTREDVLQAWERIKSRLGRKVRLECTIGISFGKDLDPVRTQPNQPPSTPDLSTSGMRQPLPLEDALSTAFIKLFGPPAP